MRRPPRLRVRLAAMVGLLSFAVLAVAGAAAVSEIDRRMHQSVRQEAMKAVVEARVGLAAGISPSQVTAVRPGEPLIRIRSNRLGDGDGTDRFWISPSRFEELPDVELGETTVVRDVLGDRPFYLALTSDRAPDGARYVVASAAPLAETERTLSTIRTATALAVPTLALVLAALAAVVAGRALRPVAKMRAEADAISHGTLHHRLTPAARSAELADLAGTMNDMLDRLEKAATGQRRFVSDVSHEFRSPLASIRGTVELAIADAESMAEGGPIALDEIDRLDALVADLLTLSRLDEGASLDLEDLDLEDVVATHVAAIGRPGLVVDTSRVEPARIRGDGRTISGMLRNLLDNAARHAEETVTVRVGGVDGEVELVVDDDGPGVPVGERDRIFDRFARLDDGRARDAGGSGLGLAVVAAAVQAHGGTAAVEDAPGGGARFRITLPKDPDSPPRKQGPARSE